MVRNVSGHISRAGFVLAFLLFGFSSPGSAADPRGAVSPEQARIQAIHRGEAGRHGDLIRVTIQGGTVRFRRHLGYRPITFNIADGETRNIILRSAQSHSRSRVVRVSYIDQAFVLESGTRGATGYRYSPRWSFGRSYQPVYLSRYTASQGRGLQVSIKIVPMRRVSVPTPRYRDRITRFGDLIRVNVSGGVMRFRRNSHRRGYYPLTFTIAEGETRVVVFKSAQRRSYSRTVKVAYRNGSFIFEDGARGARYFNFVPGWRVGKAYGPLDFASSTNSEARGIKFAISLVKPRNVWRRRNDRNYRDSERHQYDDGQYRSNEDHRHSVFVVIKGGTMVIDRQRQYYRPVRTMLFSGDRKLIKIVSMRNEYEYIYVPISYRGERVRFDGDFFIRDFPHQYRRNRTKIYRGINLGLRSRSQGSGLTIKIIKR
ncbi:MAG: hypothetical protein BMS9Abin11_1552 [Gammaproteobacteria bacterium]|nr:MAG: hypothetical protein BMS9Abin11_1552 [Gammaproteobacteria bacterium]